MGIVISFILIMALVLSGVLLISGAMMNAVDSAAAAGKETGKIITEMALTSIDVVAAGYNQGGGHSDVTLQNTGHTDLGDWAKWDVFIHYRNPNPNNYMQYVRLTYDPTAPPSNDQWSTTGIYLNQAATIPEVYEPGRLNPGEYMKLELKVSQSIKQNTSVYIKVSAANGADDNISYVR